MYTHCYGHALNLACGDTIKQSKVMRDALDTTHEITKLIKKSPKRDTRFEALKSFPFPATVEHGDLYTALEKERLDFRAIIALSSYFVH